MKAKTIIYYAILIFIPILIVIDFCYNPFYIHNQFLKVFIIFVSVVLSILSFVFHRKEKVSGYRFCFVINILFAMAFSGLCVLDYYNLSHIFSSISSLKNLILSTKSYGMAVFVLIQAAQVLFVPIPAAIITIAGAAIWGPVWGGLLDSLGVLIGSYISFAIGKIFGYKVVSYITGKENATKYARILDERGRFFLIYAFLLPLFPDDILCLIAGITTMQFKHFFFIALFTRPIGVICMSFFGTGAIIPFSGWGIFVWIVILIVAIVSMVLLTKYQNQIENFVLTKMMIKKKKKAK